MTYKFDGVAWLEIDGKRIEFPRVIEYDMADQLAKEIEEDIFREAEKERLCPDVDPKKQLENAYLISPLPPLPLWMDEDYPFRWYKWLYYIQPPAQKHVVITNIGNL